jgi:hypothetical protein
MYFDKHDYSIRTLIYELIREMYLHDLSSFPSVVEIGCGFELRYTGEIAHSLVKTEISKLKLHLVDPLLYGWASHHKLQTLEQNFTTIEFETYSSTWNIDLLRDKGELDAIVAIQATTLFDPIKFDKLNFDISQLLCSGGYFLDISEIDDHVTEPVIYRNTKVYSRTEKEREDIAIKYGFTIVKKITIDAHIYSDGHLMCGILFRKE